MPDDHRPPRYPDRHDDPPPTGPTGPGGDRLAIRSVTTHFEARWDGISRGAEDYVFKVRIKTEDMPLALINMRHGTLLVMAAVELDGDSRPVDRKLAERARKASQSLRRDPRFWAFMMERHDQRCMLRDTWAHVSDNSGDMTIGAMTDIDSHGRDQMTDACKQVMHDFCQVGSASDFSYALNGCELMIKLSNEFRNWHPRERPRAPRP